MTRPTAGDRLQRRLGLHDAVLVGLGSMLGAGVFVAFAPAAEAAGHLLLLALAIAAVIAAANALSSARLAARYPESGGTYVYGRERLGPYWGYLAGSAFVAGKTASCSAMALVVGEAVWPGHGGFVGALVVMVVAAIDYLGVQRSAAVTRLVVALVLVVLAALVAALLISPPGRFVDPSLGEAVAPLGVLQSAGFLFFAFAGYARIATLGEEVRDPERTIPRAVVVALSIVLLVYLAVAAALLTALGPEWLSGRSAPLADAAAVTGWSWLAPVVRIAAVAAAGGALLGLLLGVSRTVLAMARDGHLPRGLSAVHSTHGVPHRATLAVALVVAVITVAGDVRGAIGFSSFCVLVYYAIANASAWTLSASPTDRALPAIGLLGCLVVAAVLPLASVVAGLAVLAAAAAAWWLRRRVG